MKKTGRSVRIPILPTLRSFLLEQQQEGEYVLPAQAAMYSSNPDGISQRVQAYLNGLEIKTRKEVKGRSRTVTIKDVHSLRHTFCYIAAIHGVPFPVVQSIVGHVDPKITEIYMNHAADEAKQIALRQVPDYLTPLQDESNVDLLVEIVVSALRSFRLRKSYANEQRDLQPHIQKVLAAAFEKRFPGVFTVVISVGGAEKKPSIEALGTSFWPDVEVRRDENPILGLEVKHIKPGQSAAKPFVETFGQALVYRLRYTKVIAFVLHEGKADNRLNEDTSALEKLLSDSGIDLHVRRR